MNFCGAATEAFRSFRQVGGQRVDSLKRHAAPGLQPGVVRRVQKWKPVPKVKSARSTKPAPAADAADFCRQARRVRATLGHDPVRMHRELKQLTVAPQPAIADAPAVNPYRSTRFGREESPAAPRPVEAPPPVTGWEDPDDAFPRYTLLDPDDAPVDDEDDYDHLPPDRAFRRIVEQTFIDGGGIVLRYSQRLALLKEGERRGLARFEANLIVASVENDVRESQVVSEPPKESRASAWMIFATTQSLITAAFWRLVGG